MPVARIYIEIENQKQQMDAIVSDTLEQDMLLGRDSMKLFKNLWRNRIQMMLNDIPNQEADVLIITRNQSKRQAAEASLEKKQKDDGVIIQPVSEDSDVPDNPDTRKPVESTKETGIEPYTEEEFVPSHMAPFNFDPSLFQEVKLKVTKLSKQQKRTQAKSVHDEIERRWNNLSSSEKLAKAQKDDPTLSYFRKQANKKITPFRWSNGLLMRDARDNSSVNRRHGRGC